MTQDPTTTTKMPMTTVEYRNKKGEYHRDGDLPAVVYPNGDAWYFFNGRCHRDGDRPAVVCTNGCKYWFRDGEQYRAEHNHATTFVVKNSSLKPSACVGKKCAITLKEITSSDAVGQCCKCTAVCIFNDLSEWMKENDSCPQCKQRWTNFTKYY